MDKIVSLYALLARSTIQARIRAYVDEYNRYGFFYYGGFRFYPDEKCVRDDARIYTARNTDFLRGYGYLVLSPKDQRLGQKILGKLGGTKHPSVDTLTDTDAFFYLLSELFDLKWN